MRVAYVVVERVAGNHGVPKKFAYQLAAWREAGATCELFAAAEDSNAPNLLVKGSLFLRERKKGAWAQWREDRKVLGDLSKALEEWKPDLVYLRWGYHKPEFLDIADRYPTIVELNGDVLATAKLSAREKKGVGKILGLYVQMTLPQLFRRAAGFIAVTNEVAELPYVKKHQKPVGVFPNSIDLSEYQEPFYSGIESALPRIVFIGNVASWHGLDKVQELAKETLGCLDFDVIGCEAPAGEMPSNITFHGYLGREEYLEVFARATAGLDGVALYRKGMNEACPLKIREYLAAGLPVILSAEDTALVGIDRDWILRVGNEPGSLMESVESIVEFAKRIKGFRISHNESKTFISAADIEGRKVEFFREVLNEH